jgi:hypothetical protein
MLKQTCRQHHSRPTHTGTDSKQWLNGTTHTEGSRGSRGLVVGNSITLNPFRRLRDGHTGKARGVLEGPVLTS